MTKTKHIDPLAVVKDAVDAAVATAKDNHEKFTKTVEAEAVKAQKTAFEGLDQAVSAHHANVDAIVAATRAAFDGFAKIGELAKAQADAALTQHTADFQSVLAAKDPKTALAVQIDAAKATHKQATEAAEALAAAGREVANDVVKPVEAQVTANLQTLAKLNAA